MTNKKKVETVTKETMDKPKPKAKVSAKITNTSVAIKDIYLSNFYFQKNHDKQKIVVRDIVVTVNREMTSSQIEEVLFNAFYQTRALRSYFKSEGRVFNQAEALEKYTPVKIDFIKNLGISFAP